MGAAEHVDRSSAAESQTLELYIFAVVLPNDTDKDTNLNGLEVIENLIEIQLSKQVEELQDSSPSRIGIGMRLP